MERKTWQPCTDDGISPFLTPPALHPPLLSLAPLSWNLTVPLITHSHSPARCVVTLVGTDYAWAPNTTTCNFTSGGVFNDCPQGWIKANGLHKLSDPTLCHISLVRIPPISSSHPLASGDMNSLAQDDDWNCGTVLRGHSQCKSSGRSKISSRISTKT